MSKNKSIKKRLPVYTTIFLIALGLSILVKNQFNPKSITINEVTPSGTVSLTFGTTSPNLAPNTISTIPISINTTTSKASIATISITYNPTEVSIISLTKGDFFASELIAPSLTSGRATATYSVPTLVNVITSKQGTGTVANLAIKPLKVGNFTLAFGPETMVAALDANNNPISGNTLKTANAITYTAAPVIDGGWSSWSTKNTACGFSGTQTRTCTNPSPSNGGADCIGASTQAYTNPLCPIPGDLDLDNRVGIFDFNLLVSKFGNPYTIFDFNNIVINFGRSQ